ncbi:hypothetical protein [uncultured Megasphaera sp.]|uniref:hypothetical protein n=1 Tax=uncultured Megasphaera sp. TaxID=165188 RepID=UPI0027DB9D37|nr:hypothetical protein [uncultured Megasphaera sp.]
MTIAENFLNTEGIITREMSISSVLQSVAMNLRSKKYMCHAIGVAGRFIKNVLMLQEMSIIFAITDDISTISILKKRVQIIKWFLEKNYIVGWQR